MDAYDLSHKLAFAGLRSPVQFKTGPEYINSVPGVPVLSMLRVFIDPADWSEESVIVAAREMARVLGPREQYDIGITRGGRTHYDANSTAAGTTARLTKLDPRSPEITLRIGDGNEDRVYKARFPRLQFDPAGEDDWQSAYAPGAVKPTGQP